MSGAEKKLSVNVGLLLAAGGSSRMGSPKQLLSWRDGTFFEHSLRCLWEGGADEVVAVLGAHREAVLSHLPWLVNFIGGASGAERSENSDLPEWLAGSTGGTKRLTAVVNEGWAEGMASSLRVGLRAALKSCEDSDRTLGAVAVCPVDLPFLSREAVKRIIEALNECTAPEKAIIVPEYGERRGHPVIFGSAYFEELLSLEGDRGGSPLLRAHKDRVIPVRISDSGIFEDCDSQEQYKRICGSGSMKE
ncbi:nucleotidyltransferase family protein [bacterium]|nr:nucleotidyltransferase family protein [bacterium]